MSAKKRIPTKVRNLMIKDWEDGKEDEVRAKGFYVMKNKKDVVMLRKLKEKPEPKPKEGPVEEPKYVEKTTKDNI
ncbi:MAG: hypothetical protein LBR24_04365, partial [Methanobrevibacter sp.]|nr:hypothetical protein [Methanobrevibacter sp.]